jgi:anti-sigma B factor antagonist
MSGQPVQTAVVVERIANAVVARLQVKLLDDKDLKLLSRMIDEAATADASITAVVIALSKVQMIPSLGLGTLVQMADKCRARQQRLKLACVTPQIRQVFTITKLDRVLELADKVESAVE